MNKPAPKPYLSYEGFCPICEKKATYTTRSRNSDERFFRGSLFCDTCPRGSVPRERHLALVLNQIRPNWRELAIHESSPAQRGISAKMKAECPNYVSSHYWPEIPFGSMRDGHRNENLEAQTFADESFDLVISLDVFEHLFDPAAAHREVWRTLKPGGVHLCTFPIKKAQTDAMIRRAILKPDGTVQHLINPPQYHGNPISGDGALVTVDYGYEIHKLIPEWAPFDVTILRCQNRTAGILGEVTEVIVHEKIERFDFEAALPNLAEASLAALRKSKA